MTKQLITLAVILTPSIALAHNGHGHIEATSIWHWLLEFDHIGWIVPAVIVLFIIIRSSLLNRNK
jgi:hydrogenase/urease accessory protein HupE